MRLVDPAVNAQVDVAGAIDMVPSNVVLPGPSTGNGKTPSGPRTARRS